MIRKGDSQHVQKTSQRGLVQLKGLTELQKLILYGPFITDAGRADLGKSLPKCRTLR